MSRLIVFELKKIWNRRMIALPLTLFGVVFLWLAVTAFRPLAVVVTGSARRLNAETKPNWGRTISQDKIVTINRTYYNFLHRKVLFFSTNCV